MAIPANRNVVQKEAEKKLKYKSLCIEIQRMWNMKCTIVPVIIGTTAIVRRSLRKNLENVPGKHSILSLQKTAILGTSHIIQKVLQCEDYMTVPTRVQCGTYGVLLTFSVSFTMKQNLCLSSPLFSAHDVSASITLMTSNIIDGISLCRF